MFRLMLEMYSKKYLALVALSSITNLIVMSYVWYNYGYWYANLACLPIGIASIPLMRMGQREQNRKDPT